MSETLNPHTVSMNAGNRTAITARNGSTHDLPILLPVYHPVLSPVPMDLWETEFDVRGCIVNAFFLYKDRELRKEMKAGKRIQEHIRFSGLVMTDSGAFQGFQGKLYLENKTIVRFQEMIGSDSISPLDLVSPPGEKRTVAQKKWGRTLIRVQEALDIVEEGIVAGVQQGGRYHDLRRQCTEDLLKLKIRYLALGSLVPFFNKNHDMRFVGTVIRDARKMCGPDMPIHVYGAGDPVEIPLMVALGATIFDSSSYAHYANQGWYMTPFGAIRHDGPLTTGEFSCTCPHCRASESVASIFTDPSRMAAHNLWTIQDTMKQVRRDLEEGTLHTRIHRILELHAHWFPNSALGASWAELA